jgi:hypothetical protein
MTDCLQFPRNRLKKRFKRFAQKTVSLETHNPRDTLKQAALKVGYAEAAAKVEMTIDELVDWGLERALHPQQFKDVQRWQA